MMKGFLQLFFVGLALGAWQDGVDIKSHLRRGGSFGQKLFFHNKFLIRTTVCQNFPFEYRENGAKIQLFYSLASILSFYFSQPSPQTAVEWIDG